MSNNTPSSTSGNPQETTSPAVANGAGRADDRIDQGAEKVKQVASEAANRTKHAADRFEKGVHGATDRAAEAAHRANDRAAELTERGRQLRDEGMDKADLWMEQARTYVREKPMQSVAMALGAGWLLGRILRR